jgi:release factor glutamine methyltransferase
VSARSGAGHVPAYEAAEQLLRADSSTLASALEIPVPQARREVQILLTRALGADLAILLAHPERVPEARGTPAYAQMFARRLGGEPMAYVLSEREFYGLIFEVTPAVLIPRPETELLVEMALERLPEDCAATVLDLGTGSGCVGVSLAKLRPAARIVATDLSQAALAVAERNARRHGVTNVEFRAGSWFEPVGGERFDVIVSNPPYVAEHDPHLSQGDLRFEPSLALTAGSDGLAALRTIVSQAPHYLSQGGSLLIEHGYGQAEAVAQLLRSAGLTDVIARTDLAGIPRAAAGRRP